MMNYFQESVHIVKENMTNIHIFCHDIQQNINKKYIYFCHASLEKFVYKIVDWVIYYKDDS